MRVIHLFVTQLWKEYWSFYSNDSFPQILNYPLNQWFSIEGLLNCGDGIMDDLYLGVDTRNDSIIIRGCSIILT